jgi:hypothetical protein
MPALNFDMRLLYEVQLTEDRGWWRVHARYGERRYKLGEWPLYRDAHRACSPSALEKALGSPELRTSRQVEEAERF